MNTSAKQSTIKETNSGKKRSKERKPQNPTTTSLASGAGSETAALRYRRSDRRSDRGQTGGQTEVRQRSDRGQTGGQTEVRQRSDRMQTAETSGFWSEAGVASASQWMWTVQFV